MKKFLFFMLMPLLAFTFNSCSDNDKDDPNYEELIVGTWKMTEVIKVEGDEDDPSLFDLETITFNANNTFQFIDGDGGTYSINGKKVTIKYDGDDDDTESFEIVTLNSKEWVFKATYTDFLSSTNPNGEEESHSSTTTYTVRAIKQ